MAKAKKLDQVDRRQFAAKFMDWGNLVFIGLVIAQLVPGEKSVNWILVILGFSCMVLSYFVAERMMRGGD